MFIYRNAVMYGESLDEVPHDFYENWVMMPYPTGKRCILTTGKGIVYIYKFFLFCSRFL